MQMNKYISLVSMVVSSLLIGGMVNAESVQSVMLQSSGQSTANGLAQALQMALQNNPAVKGQQTQLSVQQEAIDAAGSAYYPTVSADISSNDEETSYVQASQPLWTFDRISSAKNTQVVGYDVEKTVLLQVERQLIQQTATAYAQVQSIRLKVTVAKENLNEHQRLYDRISRRAQGQLASTADVNLASARLLQAKADLVSYQGQLRTALTQLYALTRVQVDTQQPIPEHLIELADDKQVKALVLSHSADVSQASAKITLAKAQVRQQKTNYYPTISLRARKYLSSNYNYESQVGVIFDSSLEGLGLGTYNQVQGAQKGVKVAQYELDSTRIEVERQTDDLLLNRDVQSDLRQSQMASVKALEDTMESFLRQYEANRKSWVEVLNQQRELTNMRYSLINTDLQLMGTRLELAAQTGQLDALAGVTP